MRLASALALALLFLSLPALAEQKQLQLDRTNPRNNVAGQLSFKGAVVISPGPDKVGGFSGLHVAPDGQSFIVLSDLGRRHEGQLSWSPEGRLTGATVNKGTVLLDENGKPLRTRTRFDSESLAQLADGSWLVGFERNHRIEQYATLDAVPVPFASPPGLATLPSNSGLESLAALPDGGVLALAEGVLGDTNPLWLWQEGHWSQLSYRPQAGLAPSDAAALPNGDVVVLERGFNLFYGFRVRVALLRKAALAAGGSVTGETLALLESPLLSENFEAVAVQPMGADTVRLFIVSDNNFNAAQQTILGVFELKL